jgi:hypothetical protein
MAIWYIYHNAEGMGARYGKPDDNYVFSTSINKKICINDEVWIVEGVGTTPKKYYLAARFTYKTTSYPPFSSHNKGDNFKIMYSGPGESYDSKYDLTDKQYPWFGSLHKDYITKQRFFNDISKLTDVVMGFNSIISQR